MEQERLDIYLRSQQANYLEYMAERDESSLSAAFASILETYGNAARYQTRAPTRKVRKHIILRPLHMSILDALVLQWGIRRAEVARALLDEARRQDKTING